MLLRSESRTPVASKLAPTIETTPVLASSHINLGYHFPMTPSTERTDSELFLNRELSQLEFNFRVLAQAEDTSLPLLERLRYLCISCTNLDEFFEIRAATVRTALEYGAPLLPDRMAPTVALERIHAQAGELVSAQYRFWNDTMRPELTKAGIRVLTRDQWSTKQKRWLQKYFENEVSPV